MSHLNLSHENGIATLTMNRAEARNALSMEMRTELNNALHNIERDASVRCVVLTGAGDHFMAGGDVKAMGESIKKSPEEIRKEFMLRIHDLHPIMYAMRRMPKPIIASCRGASAGAGVSIALACDLVIAAESASFIQAFCRLGLIPDAGGTWVLPRLVGMAKAKALAMLGDKVSATDAERMGMIYAVKPDAELLAHCQELARHLATQPTYGLGLIKRALHQSLDNDLDTQLDVERDLQRVAGRSEDYRIGVDAFLNKTKPVYKGR